jgi:uncharacterized protein (TIGR03437 family)
LLSVVILLTASALADTTETRYFRGNLSPANETPPVTTEAGSAQATITAVVTRNDAGAIISGTVYYDIDYNMAQPVVFNNLHIHVGGPGVNGPTRFNPNITGANVIPASGQGNIFRAVSSTNANDVAAMEGLFTDPSGFYVNLHTSLNPGGMMRDQLQVLATPPAPNIVEGAMVSAASFALHPAPLAPGSIAALFGKYLNDGPPGPLTSFANGKLVTALGGTQVLVNGIPAPLFFSFFNLVALQIPTELAGANSATVQVVVGGRTSATRTILLEPAAPGLFSVNANGQGAGAITHANGSLITLQSPAQRDEVIVLYVTGLGVTDPPLATGAPAVLNTVPNPTVTIDGIPATVQFAGRTPGLVGLDQINVQVPSGVGSSGGLSVRVSAGARQSNTVTLATGESAPPSPTPPPPPDDDNPPDPYDGY